MSARTSTHCGDVVTFKVTLRAGIRYEVTVDAQDVAIYRSRRWVRHRRGGLVSRPKENPGTDTTTLPRAILCAKPGECVINLNGNKLDCRRTNLKIVSREDQGRMEKRPHVRVHYKDRPNGVKFKNCAHGRYAYASFRHFGKNEHKHFSIGKYGLADATRRALAWRVEMLRKHGLIPNPELVVALERTARMAKAKGGFEEIYGGNAEYENNRVVAREVAHWAQPWEEAA